MTGLTYLMDGMFAIFLYLSYRQCANKYFVAHCHPAERLEERHFHVGDLALVGDFLE